MNREKYLKFFKRELTDNLLSFWMPRCLDTENGGYFNCFSNDGSRLVSKDKYTWSQGRFLWVFSRLAAMKSDLFGESEKALFLSYAKSGKDFLLRNVLTDDEDMRCAFLLDEFGNKKEVAGHDGYDLSISADCFVVMGFAAYSIAANDKEAWDFAKRLGDSVWVRYNSDNYRSLPYPVPKNYVSHAKPMILTNVLCELYKAAQIFDSEYLGMLKDRIGICHQEVFSEFVDENCLLHEFKYANGEFADNLFGQHVNPGHTIEDMWFQLEAADILKSDKYTEKINNIVKQTMLLGWDNDFCGILHFVPCDGLDTVYEPGETANEAQMKLVIDDFGSKLWWVHSEAMYTTLLCYERTNDSDFLKLFEKVFDYTFATFPNPNDNIREWIQIRTRDGKPQEKVVALPVKDPYHIIRNVILIIELLEDKKEK